MEHIIDAKNKKLGRLASEISIILQGKRSPNYEPRLEGNDNIIIKNIAQMEFSGKKVEQKIYYKHTTQLGHLKKKTLKMILEKKGPGEALRLSVLRMLPKNKLRIKRIKRLAIGK